MAATLRLGLVQARIKGSLKVFFYDTEAGRTEIEQVFARPRALPRSPYTLEVVYNIVVRQYLWVLCLCLSVSSTLCNEQLRPS